MSEILKKFIIYLQTGKTITVLAYNKQDAVQRTDVNPSDVRSVFKITQ